MTVEKQLFQIKGDIAGIKKSFKENTDKINAQHKLLSNTLVLCKNFDSRIDTLKTLCVKAGVFTEEEFEFEHDTQSGLVRRAAGELIEKGDIVWCSYTATDESGSTVNEPEIPCRAGSKALIFDEMIIGKEVGAKDLEMTGVWNGMNLKFKINIIKAKYKIKGEEDGVGAHAADTGEDQPTIEAGRSGHEEHGADIAQPVQ